MNWECQHKTEGRIWIIRVERKWDRKKSIKDGKWQVSWRQGTQGLGRCSGVKLLTVKEWGPQLVPRTYVKASVLVPICIARIGHRERCFPLASLSSQIVGGVQILLETVSKNNVEGNRGRHPMLTSGLCSCTHKHTHSHACEHIRTCVHAHTHTKQGVLEASIPWAAAPVT